MPTTEPTACRGKVSDTVLKMLADQPWCAAAARLIRPTATHKLWESGANVTGTMHAAQINIAVLRAALTLQPLAQLDPMREIVTLACDGCKRRNYSTSRAKRPNVERLAKQKYCRWCRKKTLHREVK